MVYQPTWVVKQNDEMRRGHQYAKRMFAAWLACDTEEEIAEREGGADERVIQVQGTIIFDGSGNASVTQTAVVNFGGQATRKNQETCTFTYVVSADGTFTLQGNCSGTTIQGGNFVGQTVSTTGIKLKGQIGTRRRTLIFFGDGPNIETFVAGSTPGTLRQQLCSQTGTAVRI